MSPWVTPEAEPGEIIGISVYCPSGVEYEAALRGAILSLTEEFNWEQVGGQEVETVVEAFLAAMELTLNWGGPMPVGTVLNYAGTSIPDGYLLCDGASLLVADYPALFEAIGYVFGGEDTNFNVPDFSEKFALLLANDEDVGIEGGTTAESLTWQQLPAHRHTIVKETTVFGPSITGVIPYRVKVPLETDYTGYTGLGDTHNNMPPYVGVLAIISYR